MSSIGEAASTVTLTSAVDATSSSTISLSTGDNGCVICPTSLAVCPDCGTNQVCVLSLQTCDSCAQVVCQDLEPSSSVASSLAASASPTQTQAASTPHIYHSSSSSSSTVNTGGIIGIVVGLCCFVCIVLISLWYWLYYKPKRQKMIGAEKLYDEQQQQQPPPQRRFRGLLADNDGQSVYSVASSVLTRASNIIPIAYIPGRGTNNIRDLSNAPPVPSISQGLYNANIVHSQTGAKRVSFKDTNTSTTSTSTSNNNNNSSGIIIMGPPQSRNTYSSSRPSSTASDWNSLARASIYTSPDYIVPGHPKVVNLLSNDVPPVPTTNNDNNNNSLPNGDLLVDLSGLDQVDEEEEHQDDDQQQQAQAQENTHLIDSEIDSSRLSLGF